MREKKQLFFGARAFACQALANAQPNHSRPHPEQRHRLGGCNNKQSIALKHLRCELRRKQTSRSLRISKLPAREGQAQEACHECLKRFHPRLNSAEDFH